VTAHRLIVVPYELGRLRDGVGRAPSACSRQGRRPRSRHPAGRCASSSSRSTHRGMPRASGRWTP